MLNALIFWGAVVAAQATYPGSGVCVIDDASEWLKVCLLVAFNAGCALLCGVGVGEWRVNKGECD